ncbi:MAG: signal recognition particle-docking protein FtsY [Phycisphaeraceae bacterium]|nr:signal recognition particle-docking protein FtsY [Phycisphaeraceae bacterium]
MLRSLGRKIRDSLQRTRRVLIDPLRDLVRGRRLDEDLIREIEAVLLRADVGVKATRRMIDGLREDVKAGKLEKGEDAIAYLKKSVAAMWPPEELGLKFAAPGPTVLLVTGVNGVGKTTTIAKLCHALRADGKTVLLGACDTFRAGAVRQLEVWAERIGVEVVRGQQGGDPAAVAFDACAAGAARGVDVVILDTAGRLQTQDALMRQLEKIAKVAGKRIEGAPHESLLVLDATSGQNAVVQAEHFARAVPLTGLVITKLDGTAKGGVVIAVREACGVPVKFIGVGETAEDLQPFDPRAFIDGLFGPADDED